MLIHIRLIILFGGTATGVLNVIGLALALLIGLLIIMELWKVVTQKPWRKEYRVRKLIQVWLEKINMYRTALLQVDNETAGLKTATESWSPKEIIGHLIDSATHFHHRCVQAQLSSEIRLPEYDQNEWVAAQQYCNEPWENLVELWAQYNKHLLYLLSSLPDSSFNQHIFIGDQPPENLRTLTAAYFDHVQHHYDQIVE
jgi:hypothetical protein